ncbi:MAG: response regulator [Tissierellia bacterium]|nr:response regulator [Tissierellia bacterium]
MKDYDVNENLSIEEVVMVSEKHSEKMAALGQLAGGIAHDFNNHLMSIIGNATMIQKTDDVERIKDYADRIIHISQNAANLTKKILMFSKKESSVNKPVNLKSILDSTYNMMEFILCKEVEIIYSYDANDEFILGDESQIESMIVNMILNSRDAMANKLGIIKIGTMDTEIFSEMVSSHGEIIKAGSYILIYVEDNGSGMDEEILQKIFDPYFSTKNKTQGTGLGLSVVFGTVKSHRGYINAVSKPNKGTRFEIFIPVHKQNKEPVKKKLLDKENNIVMLVDDDINVLDVEAEMLEDLGYDIVKFSNPLEALNYYKKESSKVSFSVLDIRMPELSGNELFDQMQLIDENATVIFITGYAQQTEYEELMKRGLSIIEKPFTYEQLSGKVANLYS